MGAFWQGFEKQAEKRKDPEGHKLRRVLLGAPFSSAIEAKKGKKIKAFGESYGHGVKETLKGMGAGAAGGATVGTVGSLARAGRRGAGKGALLGGLGGAYLGGLVGTVKGSLDDKSSKIHGKYSKHKK